MPTSNTGVCRLSATAFLVGVLTLAGCAQTSAPGYYDPPKASSQQDALKIAEGAGMRQTVQPPSQIQIKLRSPAPAATPAAAPDTASTGQGQAPQDKLTAAGQAELNQTIVAGNPSTGMLIPEPQTFLGTLPCFHKDMRCTAQQVTLTLAPNGRWRARVQYLENQQASGKPMATQGCWRGVPSRPPQIILLDAKKTVRAELLMPSPPVLRLNSVNGQTPNLTYTLNRQPDLDPIAELDKVVPPNCM